MKHAITSHSQWRLYGLIAAGLFCSTGLVTAEDRTANSPKKLAMLVGIDEYNNSSEIPTLAGCINDVEDMKQLLMVDYGFQPKDIKELRGPQATRKNILETFREHLIDGTKGEDDAIVVFHYSGHGADVPDDGNDELNRFDETIVPWDSRTPGVYDIRDDTFENLFEKLTKNTENVTLIFDSCHSGTIAKDGSVPRRAKRDTRPQPSENRIAEKPARHGDRSKGSRLFDNPRFALISGCHEEQSSYEMTAPNGQRRGALTYFFTREIRSSLGKKLSYSAIMDKVRAHVRAENGLQDPQLQGAGLDKVVFGTERITEQSYVPIVVSNGNVRLRAGQVHGMTEQSVFDVYPSDVSEFGDRNTRIGQVKLTFVDTSISEAEILSGAGKFQTGARAIESEHFYPKSRVTLHFEMLAESEVLQDIHKHVTKHKDDKNHFTVHSRKGQQFLLISEIDMPVEKDGTEKDQRVVEIYGSGGAILETFPIDMPNVQNEVVTRLKHWAKWYNLLSISNTAPSLTVDFRLEPVTGTKGAKGVRNLSSPELTVIDDGNTETKEVQFRVENKSDQKVFFAILDIATDGSVTPIYPPRGVSEALPPEDENDPLAHQWLNKRKLPFSTNAYVPEGRERITDVFKLIATTEPVDFSFIRLNGRSPTPKGPMGRSLQNLFMDSVLKTKNAAPIGAVEVSGWTTEEFVLEVVRDSRDSQP